MVNNKDFKDLSKEERAQFYEQRFEPYVELDEARIADLQGAYELLGSNYLRTNLGSEGKQIGQKGNFNYMTSEFANNKRKELYDALSEQYSQAGIPDMPEIQNSQLNYHITTMANVTFREGSSQNLEKILANVAPELKIGENDLISKANEIKEKAKKTFVENGQFYKYNQEEREILQDEEEYRQSIMNSYHRSAAKKVFEEHFYDADKATFNSFNEKYAKQQEESSEKSEEENSE